MPEDPKKVTISNVAKLADVSVATVSRVLNHHNQVKSDTRKKVMAAVETLGYEFDNSPQAEKSTGLLLMNIPTMNNPFYSEVISGAKASASRHGYTLLVNQEHINSDTLPLLVELIGNVRTVGVITTNSISLPHLQKLAQLVPLVQCCEYVENFDGSYVSVDDFTAAKNATEFLLATGRKRIALLNGPMRYKYARHRRNGYLAALENAGIIPDDKLMLQIADINFDLAISAVTTHLAGAALPDAYLAASDVLAAAAIKGAQQAGLRVPDDLMVVGFDNIDIAVTTTPPITTMNLPRFQLGYIACELLIEKLQNPETVNQQILLGTELVMRESATLLKAASGVSAKSSNK